jgi:hypothetical protein
MSDSLVDAVADLVIPDAATFASLPLPLACHVFLALPADARGRASCVCRAWRDMLADPSLWTRLVLSVKASSGLERAVRVLHGAAGRARGEHRQLEFLLGHVALDALLPMLTAYAGSLREVHLQSVYASTTLSPPNVEAVVAAAPLLQVLTADYVHCQWEDAPRMLRAEPPFALLQMRGTLDVHCFGGMDRVGPFAAALADAALQPALFRIGLLFADVEQPVVMDALVDAALARRLRALTLEFSPPPAAAPLARLLAEGSLVAFKIRRFPQRAVGHDSTPLIDASGAALVADALRVNTTLTQLVLWRANLCLDMDAAGTLLGSLVDHPSLRELSITGENYYAEHCHMFGAALAALIAADAPALHILNCSANYLRDDGLTPIVQALPLNHHLRELDMSENSMSEAFARERLLPAARANTSLRELKCITCPSGPRAAAEAAELVRLRGEHG